MGPAGATAEPKLAVTGGTADAAVLGMSVPSRCMWVALGGLVTILVAPFIASEALYGYALHDLGGPPSVPVAGALPRLAPAAFWLHSGEDPPLVAEPMPAWRWAWTLMLDRRALGHRGWRAASLAARSWLPDRAIAPRGRGAAARRGAGQLRSGLSVKDC